MYGEKRNISGERIRQRREELGIYQADMPKLLRRHGWSISPRAYAFVETGQRTVRDWQLRILADALGVTTDWLVQRGE